MLIIHPPTNLRLTTLFLEQIYKLLITLRFIFEDGKMFLIIITHEVLAVYNLIHS